MSSRAEPRPLTLGSGRIRNPDGDAGDLRPTTPFSRVLAAERSPSQRSAPPSREQQLATSGSEPGPAIV